MLDWNKHSFRFFFYFYLNGTWIELSFESLFLSANVLQQKKMNHHTHDDDDDDDRGDEHLITA